MTKRVAEELGKINDLLVGGGIRREEVVEERLKSECQGSEVGEEAELS